MYICMYVYIAVIKARKSSMEFICEILYIYIRTYVFITVFSGLVSKSLVRLYIHICIYLYIAVIKARKSSMEFNCEILDIHKCIYVYMTVCFILLSNSLVRLYIYICIYEYTAVIKARKSDSVYIHMYICVYNSFSSLVSNSLVSLYLYMYICVYNSV